jgi:hypothetical protein
MRITKQLNFGGRLVRKYESGREWTDDFDSTAFEVGCVAGGE